MEVLTAPERMRNPTMTTKTRKMMRRTCGPDHVHGEAGDQVVLVDWDAHGIRNEHDGQQGGEAGEEQAVDGDDDGGALQVLQLGMLDLAIDLGQGLFAAHGQHGVAEGHEDAEEAEHLAVADAMCLRKPSASGLKLRLEGAGAGRQVRADMEDGVDAPEQAG